jgi:hypothetical protein
MAEELLKNLLELERIAKEIGAFERDKKNYAEQQVIKELENILLISQNKGIFTIIELENIIKKRITELRFF